MTRSARLALLTSVTLVTLSFGGYACRPERQPTAVPTEPPASAQAVAQPTPEYFQLPVSKERSGLRLLTSGWFADVDRGPLAAQAVAVTRWLPRWDRNPTLLDERLTGADFGRFRFSSRREPKLSGRPLVTVIHRPALGSVVAADGDDRTSDTPPHTTSSAA